MMTELAATGKPYHRNHTPSLLQNFGTLQKYYLIDCIQNFLDGMGRTEFLPNLGKPLTHTSSSAVRQIMLAIKTNICYNPPVSPAPGRRYNLPQLAHFAQHKKSSDRRPACSDRNRSRYP